MDSGILIQIQAFWYGYRHSAIDSGTGNRFRHSATDQGICYRVMQTGTWSCNLLQSHAIWYRVVQFDTGSCNLIQSHAFCYRVKQSARGLSNLMLQGIAIREMSHIKEEGKKLNVLEAWNMEMGKSGLSNLNRKFSVLIFKRKQSTC